MPVTWSDEKLILLNCPGRGWNSRPSARRSFKHDQGVLRPNHSATAAVFDGAINLECLRTTGPLFRTYEPSDYRTFITESYQCRCRTYEPSDCRTFGMKNLLFRTYEPSDYRTFGLESSLRGWVLLYERVYTTTSIQSTTADYRHVYQRFLSGHRLSR